MIFLALPCILGSPCYYGATCYNNNVGGYTCSCITGYTGTDCQYGMLIIKEITLFRFGFY